MKALIIISSILGTLIVGVGSGIGVLCLRRVFRNCKNRFHKTSSGNKDDFESNSDDANALVAPGSIQGAVGDQYALLTEAMRKESMDQPERRNTNQPITLWYTVSLPYEMIQHKEIVAMSTIPPFNVFYIHSSLSLFTRIHNKPYRSLVNMYDYISVPKKGRHGSTTGTTTTSYSTSSDGTFDNTAISAGRPPLDPYRVGLALARALVYLHGSHPPAVVGVLSPLNILIDEKDILYIIPPVQQGESSHPFGGDDTQRWCAPEIGMSVLGEEDPPEMKAELMMHMTKELSAIKKEQGEKKKKEKEKDKKKEKEKDNEKDETKDSKDKDKKKKKQKSQEEMNEDEEALIKAHEDLTKLRELPLQSDANSEDEKEEKEEKKLVEEEEEIGGGGGGGGDGVSKPGYDVISQEHLHQASDSAGEVKQTNLNEAALNTAAGGIPQAASPTALEAGMIATAEGPVVGDEGVAAEMGMGVGVGVGVGAEGAGITNEAEEVEEVELPPITSPLPTITTSAIPQSDVFSLGLVLWEIATGRVPYATFAPTEALRRIKRGDKPPLEEIPDHHLRSIVRSCLLYDPNYRPSAFQLMREIEQRMR